jgi:hypothetical protein
LFRLVRPSFGCVPPELPSFLGNRVAKVSSFASVSWPAHVLIVVARRDSICLHSFNRIGLGGSACRRAISFTADFSRHCVLPIEDFDCFRPAGFQCESRIETL